jgi:glycosyl transferase, family 25
MDQESERFRQFALRNAHLNYTVFQAINGAELSRAESINANIVTEECLVTHNVTPGHIGCAASHREVWKMAAKTDIGCLILEDDVITHPGLAKFATALARRASDIEIVLYAINTDSVLVAKSPQGFVQTMYFQDKHPPPERIVSILKSTKVGDVRIWRLFRAFGCAAYFVSPAGARKLLASALPMRSDGVPIPLVSKNVPGVSVDSRLNALYGKMQAAVAVPFLAWTPNSDSATHDSPQG